MEIEGSEDVGIERVYLSIYLYILIYIYLSIYLYICINNYSACLERYILLSAVPALVVLCVTLAVQDLVLIACAVMVASPTSGVDRKITLETRRLLNENGVLSWSKSKVT